MSKETALDKLNQLIKEMGLEGEPVVYMKVGSRENHIEEANRCIRSFVPNSYRDAPIIPRPQPLDYFRPENQRKRNAEKKAIVEINGKKIVVDYEPPTKEELAEAPVEEHNEPIDYTHKVFGKLYVMEDRGDMWLCGCECGIIKEFVAENVLSGKKTSCGECDCHKEVTPHFVDRDDPEAKNNYKKALKGNEDAIEWLIKHYEPLLIENSLRVPQCFRDDYVQELRIEIYQLLLNKTAWSDFRKALSIKINYYVNQYKKQYSADVIAFDEELDEEYSEDFEYNDEWIDIELLREVIKSHPETFVHRFSYDSIYLYYVTEATLDEVAKKLGLTRERIRQIINRTIRILRKSKLCNQLQIKNKVFTENT